MTKRFVVAFAVLLLVLTLFVTAFLFWATEAATKKQGSCCNLSVTDTPKTSAAKTTPDEKGYWFKRRSKWTRKTKKAPVYSPPVLAKTPEIYRGSCLKFDCTNVRLEDNVELTYVDIPIVWANLNAAKSFGTGYSVPIIGGGGMSCDRLKDDPKDNPNPEHPHSVPEPNSLVLLGVSFVLWRIR